MEMCRHKKVPDFDEEEVWLSWHQREFPASFQARSW
jgi:hypothetical protein